jgi:hypothetical protein
MAAPVPLRGVVGCGSRGIVVLAIEVKWQYAIVVVRSWQCDRAWILQRPRRQGLRPVARHDDPVEVEVTQGWQTHGRSAQSRKRRKARPPVKTAQTAAPAAAGQVDAPRPASSGVTFKSASRPSGATLSIHAEDYGYIYHDLRRIAVVAGALFAVLIVLTFIIR